jgi:uncharacterized protein (TIGR00251 family)
MPSSAAPHESFFTLAVKVIPSAPANKITGRRGEELVVKIKAPAVDGKATRELIAFLAVSLGINKNEVYVTHGAASRHKLIVLPLSAKLKLESILSSLAPG